MRKSVIQRAIYLVGFYKAGLTNDYEVPFCIGGEPDTMVKIAVAQTNTNEGDHGVCEYDVTGQVTLRNVLDDKDGVVIIAPYGKKHHVYVAEYDPDIDLHAPLFFLGVLA